MHPQLFVWSQLLKKSIDFQGRRPSCLRLQYLERIHVFCPECLFSSFDYKAAANPHVHSVWWRQICAFGYEDRGRLGIARRQTLVKERLSICGEH